MKSHHARLRFEDIMTTHTIATKVLSYCTTPRDNGADSHMANSIQAP